MPKDPYEIWLKALRKKLAEAVAKARPMVNAGQFNEAEKVVQATDQSIYSAVAIGQMYADALRELVTGSEGKHDRGKAEAIYARALHWKQSAYPEPHTGEEAKRYGEGQNRDRADLVAILGYDPKAT